MTEAHPLPATSARTPTWLTCALTLGHVRIRLRMSGLARAYQYASMGIAGTNAGHEDLRTLVERTVRRVAQCATLYPGRARCLEQSLAVLRLMRVMGVPAEFRMGVQPYGFVAHAWIEYNGVPIGEPDEIIRRVVPLPALPVV